MPETDTAADPVDALAAALCELMETPAPDEGWLMVAEDLVEVLAEHGWTLVHRHLRPV